MKIKLNIAQGTLNVGDEIDILKIEYITIADSTGCHYSFYQNNFTIIKDKEEKKQPDNSPMSLKNLLGQEVKMIEFR